MTVNEVKIAALRLMFTNYSDSLLTDDVDTMTNEEYTQYTVNMDAAINRCFGRIERSNVIKPSKLVFEYEDGTVGDYYTEYDLSTLVDDFMSIQRVIKKRYANVYNNIAYGREGDTLLLPNLKDENETYTLMYNRLITRITTDSTSATELDVPQRIAEIIPYYIKAELYEEDEPALATQARNIFEATLASYKRGNDSGYNTGVVNKWSEAQ